MRETKEKREFTSVNEHQFVTSERSERVNSSDTSACTLVIFFVRPAVRVQRVLDPSQIL